MSSSFTKSFIAIAVIAAACSSNPPPPPADGGMDAGSAGLGSPCTSSESCASGDTCVTTFTNGYCSLQCSESSDCGDGGVCGMIAGSSACLQACTSDSSCRTSDDYVCDPTLGGCIPSCSTAPDGGSLNTCATGSQYCDSTGHCQNGCMQDTDCGSGLYCANASSGSAGTCLSGCSVDSECSTGQSCVSNTCTTATTPASDGGLPDSGIIVVVNDAGSPDSGLPDAGPAVTTTIGASCTSTTTCSALGANAQCVGTGAADGGETAGVCTAVCTADSDCGTGGVCLGGAFGLQDGGTVAGCFQSCTASSNCDYGYACNVSEPDVSGSTVTACALGCASDTDCNGGTCDTATGACSGGASDAGMSDGGPLSVSDGGSAGYCQPCQSDMDCGGTDNDAGISSNGNYCLCANQGCTVSFCGTACTASSDCPVGASCYPVMDLAGATFGNDCEPTNGVCGGSEDGGTPPEDGGTLPEDGGVSDAGTLSDGGTSTLGMPCTSPQGCAGESACTSEVAQQDTASAGFYCSPVCSTNSDCGSEGVCITNFSGGNSNGFCLLACSHNSDCTGVGDVCDGTFTDMSGSTVKACFIPCVSNTDCGRNGWDIGHTCDTTTGVCQ